MSVNSMTEKKKIVKTLIYKAWKLNDLDMVKYLIKERGAYKIKLQWINEPPVTSVNEKKCIYPFVSNE